MTAQKNLVIKTGFPVKEVVEIDSVTLNKKLSVESFKALAVAFPDLRMERDKNGKTTIMSPVKFGTGFRESLAIGYVMAWWLQNGKSGKPFSSSVGIELADTSIKCPDAGWISAERIAKNPVTDDDGEFLKIAPNFIIEVKSKTDSLKKLKKKMIDAWIKNGAQLAWLIDPYKQKAYIYRAGETKPEEVKGFDNQFLDGEKIVKGFRLALDDFKIFNKSRK